MSVSRDANMEVHWPLFRKNTKSVSLVVLRGGCLDRPVCIDPPLSPRRFDRGDPLLCQRLVPCAAELPCVAWHVRLAGVFGLNVEPEVGDGDVVGVDGGEEFADLGRDGFAGDACGLGAGA